MRARMVPAIRGRRAISGSDAYAAFHVCTGPGIPGRLPARDGPLATAGRPSYRVAWPPG